MIPTVAQLADVVPAAKSMEELARPLLQMLVDATGMESAYLTSVDAAAGQQHVRLARNADADFAIQEGLAVAWEDTLCRRALDEGRFFTDDVPGRWGDSQAARSLGICSYASAPIRGGDGELLGTLCAASPRRHEWSDGSRQLLQLFSALIGQWVERERLVESLRASNARLASYALTDPLTGLPNRRALVEELQRMLARGRREGACVLVGMVDLDGFKQINDRHGHQIGDEFLKLMAERLAQALRATDALGRIGGDEFVILGPGPAMDDALVPGASIEASGLALQNRCQQATVGHCSFGELSFDYAGASVGVVVVDPRDATADEALRRADAAMYAVKRQRAASLRRAA